MDKKDRLKEIREKIDWCKASEKVSNFMLKLGDMGFEFNGHGFFMDGEEVFQLFNKDLHVDICTVGRKTIIGVIKLDKNDQVEEEFEGTIGQALKWLKTQNE